MIFNEGWLKEESPQVVLNKIKKHTHTQKTKLKHRQSINMLTLQRNTTN